MLPGKNQALQGEDEYLSRRLHQHPDRPHYHTDQNVHGPE